MKQIKFVAIGMIACALVAVTVGLSFFFVGLSSGKPQKEQEDYIKEGDIYLDDGDNMLAVESYQKALELEDSNTDALIGMAEAYSNMNYYAEEERVREKLAQILPDNAENWEALVMAQINQGKLEDAKFLIEDLVTKYEDEKLLDLYHQMHIDIPSFNLKPGSYDSYQLLALETVPDNALVYYTTDGREPSNADMLYEDGIILSYPNNKIKAKAIGIMGYESDVVELDYQITAPVEEISSNDIYWTVRDELNKDWNDPIYNYEMAQFTSLYILGEYQHNLQEPSDIVFYSDGYAIYGSKYTEWGETDIRIVSYMPFLKTLSIGYQESVDLSYLSDLQYLEELSLLNDNITDIDELKHLKNLRVLALGWNRIEDVSALGELHNLESLGLWDNQIKDVSCLKDLSGLKYFDITRNLIRDVHCIDHMPELSELWVVGNPIDDMSPIHSCESLSVLRWDEGTDK